MAGRDGTSVLLGEIVELRVRLSVMRRRAEYQRKRALRWKARAEAAEWGLRQKRAA